MKKKFKSFSSIGFAVSDQSYRFSTIWRLLEQNLSTAWELPEDWKTTRLYGNKEIRICAQTKNMKITFWKFHTVHQCRNWTNNGTETLIFPDFLLIFSCGRPVWITKTQGTVGCASFWRKIPQFINLFFFDRKLQSGLSISFILFLLQNAFCQFLNIRTPTGKSYLG